MFQQSANDTGIKSAATVAELIYHNTVRAVRKTHANAFMAITMNIVQTVIFVMAFYLMFSVLGLRGSAIRGDFLLYIMTGIFLYMVNTRTVTAVLGSEGPSSAMMKHRPMTTAIAIAASALSTLYVQILSMLVVTYVYHVIWGPIAIHYWPGALVMVILTWFYGVAVGICFLALKPWFPQFTSTLAMIYTRANMIASGKMFVANQLPGYMLAWFSWNPLFHTIDQSRGFAFVNYFPHYSSWEFALKWSFILLLIGLMGEFYTRRHASLSWDARR
ncbi:ABC transporter permease [Maribius pontilimi]|uniref:ABC transporter permease n=1 Tax=Palleronia pontilimi TaxID=1964209 RepID=A0A934MBD5_9RHOB|nr:ABC transporter permease [Palleronia pontilimi]MBJ3761598.1 ABC transporter permease [Palleronia pontilimi]